MPLGLILMMGGITLFFGGVAVGLLNYQFMAQRRITHQNWTENNQRIGCLTSLGFLFLVVGVPLLVVEMS